MTKTALVLVSNGTEEIETYTVADILVRGGIEVTFTSIHQEIRGSRNLPMSFDIPVEETLEKDWDLVYVPGGLPQAKNMQSHEAAQTIIKKQLESENLLAIICAAPISLIPQGLAQGKTLTCFPAHKEDLINAGAKWLDQKVVCDSNLITSQGPGTAMDLGLNLIAKMTNPENAKEVSAKLLYPNWEII